MRELRPLYQGKIEVIYTDDVDLISEDKELLEHVLEKAQDILGKWFLTVNREKTERTEKRRMNN